MQEELELISKSVKDPAVFKTLYQRYHEPVFRFIYQRLDDEQTAADVTSQVFCKALLNLKKYTHRGLPFSSWLYRIAKNEVYTLFEKNKATRTLNVYTESFPELIGDMEEDNKEELYQKLTKVIASLPEEELQLIELRYFDGMRFKEVAEVLDITENNAKVKTYRVLEKMKKQLLS